MPEICGNAAEYFNPYNSEELSVAINKIVYSDNCRLKLINNSKSNVKKFTWKKCAEKTINVYNKFIF
jgi:glycosyltransferase involved in cell wall biosynthesis